MSLRRPSALLVLLSYVGFVSLGLPDGLLGVATPSLRATFALAPEDVGGLLLAFTTGYLASSFNGGWLVARLGIGALLALSCLLTAVSLLGYAAAPAWWVVLGAAVVSGLGGGAIDAGLNAWAATHCSARTVNWLHAFYGVGAATGPLLMTAVLASGRPWRAGYALVGAGQLVLACCFAATRRLWAATTESGAHAESGTGSRAAVTAPLGEAAAGDATSGDAATTVAAGTTSAPDAMPTPSTLETLRLRATWLGVAVFFVYTGIEATAGVWAYSVLTQARGVAPAVAGTWASAFWIGLTAGRFLFGVIAGRAPLVVLLRGCMLAIALGALLFALDLGDVATVAGLVLCGFAMAPIFPSLIATTPERLGAQHTANAVGFQVAAAILGAALLPGLAGVLVGRFGLEAVGPLLVAGALVLIALHELLQRGASRLPADRR